MVAVEELLDNWKNVFCGYANLAFLLHDMKCFKSVVQFFQGQSENNPSLSYCKICASLSTRPTDVSPPSPPLRVRGRGCCPTRIRLWHYCCRWGIEHSVQILIIQNLLLFATFLRGGGKFRGYGVKTQKVSPRLFRLHGKGQFNSPVRQGAKLVQGERIAKLTQREKNQRRNTLFQHN